MLNKCWLPKFRVFLNHGKYRITEKKYHLMIICKFNLANMKDRKSVRHTRHIAIYCNNIRRRLQKLGQ